MAMAIATAMQRWQLLLLRLGPMLLTQIHGFAPVHYRQRPFIHAGLVLSMVRVSDLRRELDERHVDYSDCFDKESLQQRLQDAMDGRIPVRDSVKESPADTASSADENDTGESKKNEDATTVTESTPEIFDEAKAYEEVRAMKVKELREELARRRIRWADLFEKSDLIRAVVDARRAASSFSSYITPGAVADLTDEQVEEEIQSTTSAPLLLDVYATWCGPCKMMAKELSTAAAEWQDRVRLAKIDSDKFPDLASTLKVKGLPTIILFDHGREVDRLEGALPKAQLMQWVENKLQSSS